MCVCVCYLGLCIGLQSEQTAHLDILGVNDSRSNKVGWIWIHSVQQGHSEPQDLKDQEKAKGADVQQHVTQLWKQPASSAIYFRSFPKINGIENIQRYKTIYYIVVLTNQALHVTR